MRIALLVCDHVAEAFQEAHGDYVYMFGKLFPEFDLKAFHVVDQEFPDVDDFDAFVVTGSKHSVYEELEWIRTLKELTKEAFEKKKKYLGVCFGHQLIAESLGGKVNQVDQGYLIGLHTFTLAENPPWMITKQSQFKVLMLCQDQVTTLPPDARVLASSEDCPVALMTVHSHFFSIQGHPEFTKAYNQDVFESRVDRIGQAKVNAARQSLTEDPDTEWLHQLLKGFLLS